MLKNKRGVSIISLVLCAVSVVLIISAVVVATNNSLMYRAYLIANRYVNETEAENLAYSKIYTKHEVIDIARQAFVNNYLSLYDNEVDFEGFKALVIGEMMQTIPINQLEDYNINITQDGVIVE